MFVCCGLTCAGTLVTKLSQTKINFMDHFGLLSVETLLSSANSRGICEIHIIVNNFFSSLWRPFNLFHCSLTLSRTVNRIFVMSCIRALSHYAKFCLICQKICQREAISSANDFLHPPKFLQEQRNFKDSVN